MLEMHATKEIPGSTFFIKVLWMTGLLTPELSGFHLKNNKKSLYTYSGGPWDMFAGDIFFFSPEMCFWDA